MCVRTYWSTEGVSVHWLCLLSCEVCSDVSTDALSIHLTKCIHVGSIYVGWWDRGGSGRTEVKRTLRKEWSWKRGNRLEVSRAEIYGGKGRAWLERSGWWKEMTSSWSHWWMKKTMMGRSDILYLALHQHGNVNKHVMQLLDAAFQTDNVFVSGFNLTQGLFRDARVHNLCRGEASVI